MTLDPWQFRIRLADAGDGRAVGRVRVETGPGLDEVLLEDAAGQPVGLLLGFPIDLETRRRLTGGTHRLSEIFSGDVDAFAEAILENLAGRFLLLWTAGNAERIYMDASGQVPCVYDPEMRMAASSAFALLAPQDYDARFDEKLHERLGIGGLGWIPGGLTAHRGVLRLLPNHRLDLQDFVAERHWPPTVPSETADPDRAISTLIETVQAQIEALVGGQRRLALALTAGRETRMLLGCVRVHAKDIDFVTVAAAGNEVDTVMARRIAANEGLIHRMLPLKLADPVARRTYLRRNGDCIADANADSFPSVAPIAESHVFIGGAGGEVGRGFFWRASDTAETVLDGTALMARFGLPPEPRLSAALDTWCAGLQGWPVQTILDLAYVEHRMGPWGGAQFPSDPTLVRLAPLLTRPGLRAMMSLPAEWKRSERMSEAVLRATWPELLRYPFNTLGPLRDGLSKVRKVLRDPAAILRKLRKRFG